MDEVLLKIGELADFSGISTKALRVYEKMELIKPVKVDEETGYRYYSPDQVKDVEALLEWKDMGFSLKEIQILFSAKYSGAIIEKTTLEEIMQFYVNAKKKEWQEKIWIAEAKIGEIDQLGCTLKYDESTDFEELSKEDRAWYLSKLAVINDSNVRQAISEAIWL